MSNPTTKSEKNLPPLLIIDDEKDNLDALNRLLRLQFNVTTTTSPIDALKLITKQTFHIILSDQRMPEMTGVELLEKAKAICPETVRILLTGYTDVDSVIGAINRGNIYRYIAKPWDPEDLKLTLRQASEAFLLRRELELKNEQLRRNLVALESVDRAKARFLSLVSHELKTPLTVLSSFVDLLKQSQKDLSADLQKAVASLGNASSRFSEVIEEVLSFVKWEGEAAWELGPVPLLDEALQVRDKVKSIAEKKKISVTVKPLAHPQAHSKAEPLRDALVRLTRDAILRAPEGSEIRITVSGSDQAVWQVERKGPALEASAFEPLEVSGNLFHHHRDIGLNLAIARVILDRLGAKTSLESSPESQLIRIEFPLP